MCRIRLVFACVAAAMLALFSACTPTGRLDRLPASGEGQPPLSSGTAVYVHPAWGITLYYPIFAIHAASSDPELLKQMFAIAATIEFDADKLAALRAQPVFAGDERAIKATVERLQPHAEPECDIVCRDQKALEQSPIVTPVGPTP